MGDDYVDDDDAPETLPNRERGCGFLKPNQTYLRSDGSALGCLPQIVVLDPPIPYKEGSFRNIQYFPGVQFELAVQDRVDFEIPESYQEDGLANLVAHPMSRYESRDEVPEQEAHRHINRLEGSADGSHAGEMQVARAHDLLDWVGETHYEEPEEFIQEAKTMGVNRAIPTSKNQQPPVVNPGKTRLWFVHPNAVDGEKPGIIGYAYLTRVVHTSDDDGEAPQWAQELADAGRMDIVERGEEIPADEDPNGNLDNFAGAGGDGAGDD